uniref:TPR_REGION domain-containing protein n=3 Tax=Macrostomum lignano TaxID=282301 RepID=A0A1I8G618_9PLAT
MDDCTLEKLGVKPGPLTPAFNKDVTSYFITLASDAEAITLDPRTSDNGASYEIKGGGDGGKTVPVEPGAKLTLTIQVTAEDGQTTRNYVIAVNRLSAKDASLASLTVGPEGCLEPAFSPEQLSYECQVPYSATTLKVEAAVSDPKIGLTVQADAMSDGAVTLNLGATSVLIEVRSADGSTKRLYSLTVLRGACPRHIQLTDTAEAASWEDPISLSLLHRPVGLPSSADPAQLYSAQLLDAAFRPTCTDPADGSPLPPSETANAPTAASGDIKWQPRPDAAVDARLSACPAEIVDLRAGAGGASTLRATAARQIGADLAAQTSASMSELRKNYQHCKPDAATAPDAARQWERRLRNIFDVSDAKQLVEMGEKSAQQYLDSLPEDPAISRSYPAGSSPQDHLLRACNAYACAIDAAGSSAPNRWQLHLRLGQLLEEMQHCQDVRGVKIADAMAGDTGVATSAGTDTAALDSAKEDEIDAICRLRGVSDSAGLGAKLRALDAEMRHLRDQGQSSKADSVQSLFLWKSRQATAEGAAQQRAASSESPLSHALDKYRDALSLADSNGELHCHVGRLMVARGEYGEAIRRLESALSWQPNNPAARLYLGAALARDILQSGKDSQPPRAPEAIDLLCDGLETLLQRLQVKPESKRCLFAEEPLQPTDHALLRAALSLGQLNPEQQ